MPGAKADPYAAHALSWVAALIATQSGNLFAVGQTVGQPTRTVADISDLAHAPDATLARIPNQRFCPDTEEVTGSNPVSPTKKALVSGHFAASLPAFDAWIG
jgi:hypothetical protein